MPPPMTPAHFVAKWSATELSERAASQEHFLDICRLLNQPSPADVDATGAEYAFEKGVTVTGPASRTAKGAGGFADVWWRGKFAWEYKRKGKHASLDEAYRQLLQYREALENPPLLVVSDITRTEIHTNFTNTAKCVHVVELARLADPESLDLLRRIFTEPESFKPEVTTESVTRDAAEQIGTLARALRDRGHDPHTAAHFLMKCMFCFFAEDVGLLPGKMFERMLRAWQGEPAQLAAQMSELFDRMRTGGTFGIDLIPHFNGGLFDEAPALELTHDEIAILLRAAGQDWASVEPAVFGTLFERSLDPNTRAQIGAHYTSRADILLVVEPVIMQPLRREWAEVQRKIDAQLARRRKAKTKPTRGKADDAIYKLLGDFIGRVANVRVLDPACGSGNFLYVAIQQLLELEKEVITFAARKEFGRGGLLPQVRPTQLHGIEINPYAAELAQVVIWIGYLQWMRDNGFVVPRNPILEPIQSIACRDAILDLSDPENPKPADWPEADFIIGNPPFLGSSLLRQGLGDVYVSALFSAFDLPRTSDLCCYWFERARRVIGGVSHVRAGLLATQAIRGGGNRVVLEKITQEGQVFEAWSDRNWILEGAAVHVSIIAFDSGLEDARTLDGIPCTTIYSDLTTGLDLTVSLCIPGNESICFRGWEKGGAFDINLGEARRMLGTPNPRAESNLAVIFPYLNGRDVGDRARGAWMIDFGAARQEWDAAQFEAPYEYLGAHVKPGRQRSRDKRLSRQWWLHRRSREELRGATARLSRFIGTIRHAKHRLFVWVIPPVILDDALCAFAREDDYFFGVLHSSVHELWARRMGTQLREAESGFRYTPTTCFETFPLPWPPGDEPVGDALHARIGEAAADLDAKRRRWLNPPEWIEPLAARIDAEDDFADVPEEARALMRESAIMAAAARDPQLKKRTLTNLYNERPTWLALCHATLDRAVLAAYAAVDAAGEWSEDWAEVWRDSGAGQPLAEDHPLAARRAEVDERVLGNLLRMNLARAAETA